MIISKQWKKSLCNGKRAISFSRPVNIFISTLLLWERKSGYKNWVSYWCENCTLRKTIIKNKRFNSFIVLDHAPSTIESLNRIAFYAASFLHFTRPFLFLILSVGCSRISALSQLNTKKPFDNLFYRLAAIKWFCLVNCSRRPDCVACYVNIWIEVLMMKRTLTSVNLFQVLWCYSIFLTSSLYHLALYRFLLRHILLPQF